MSSKYSNRCNNLLDTKKIDLLNIALIVVSLLIAISIPFKLFILSYAILGPLHYLTELFWLREKDFYMKSPKKWAWIFLIFAFFLSLFTVVQTVNIPSSKGLNAIISFGRDHSNLFLVTAFVFAIGTIFFQKKRHVIVTLLISALIAMIMDLFLPETLIFIGLFLPTLFHVYLFTLLFIIYGSIKSKNRSGLYLSFCLFLVPFIIAYMPVNHLSYSISQNTSESFMATGMIFTSQMIADFFNGLENGHFHALSEIGYRIQIFIAFAYTYHYLNWFSKTSVIGWKKGLSKNKAIWILVIWVLSVSLYFYDYKSGFLALFFLSYLHVFLEFPLNITSIKGLFDLVLK